MSTPTFEDVVVPQGTYISWGPKPGQDITVRVVSYDPTGGTDFNGAACPQLVGVLTGTVTNYREKGSVTEELEADTMVTINCGLANLKRNVQSAAPEAGDLLRLHYYDLAKSDKGDVKLFKAQIARGAGKAPAAADDDLL